MQNNKVLWIGAIIIIIFVVWIAISGHNKANVPGELDQFASCLKDKGIKFYGAFWCPHCAAQKALFGNSVKLLPYIECSTADAKGQTQACIDAKITSYPTWEFPPTGTATTSFRLSGEIALATLAEQSGCQLPSDQANSTATSTATSTTGASSNAQ